MTLSKREFYDKKAVQYPRFDSEALLRFQRAIECASLRPDDVVLDVGCKFGDLRHLFQENRQQIQYYGIDISAQVLAEITCAGDDHFFAADVKGGLPFADGTFDRVFMLEVLEHVENPSQCLREVKRVLNSTGRLILSVPNPYCWNELYGNLFDLPENEGHIAAWTPQVMGTLANLSGFRVDSRRGTFLRVPLSRRLLRDRYWIIPTNLLFLTRSFIYVMLPVEQ